MAKPKTATPAAKKGFKTWRIWIFLGALAAGIWFWPDIKPIITQKVWPWIKGVEEKVEEIYWVTCRGEIARAGGEPVMFDVDTTGNWFQKPKGKRMEFIIWTSDKAPAGTFQSTLDQLECKLQLSNGGESDWVSFKDYEAAELWVYGPINLFIRMKPGKNEKAWIRSRKVPLPPRQLQQQPTPPPRVPAKNATTFA